MKFTSHPVLHVVRCVFVLCAGSLACAGCTKTPTVPADIFADLGEVLPAATSEHAESFHRGRALAEHRFTRADGLGPHFNVTFCGACHEKPVFGGGAGRYRNFLIVATTDGDEQDLAGVNGVQPQFDLDESRFPTDVEVNLMALRNPIPFFGLGLLAEIPEEAILANADPRDEDGDGVSGRVNLDRGFVGRFGRKAQTTSIEGFIRGPLFNHLGITTDPLPPERKASLPMTVPFAAVETGGAREALTAGDDVEGQRHAQATAVEEPTVDHDGVPDPELSEQDLFDLVSFAMLLAAPRPDPVSEQTTRGLQAFRDVQCDACHVESLEGPRGLIPAYSDLLIHDMGPELSDGVTMGRATGSEFRTQPLWGLMAVGPFLHDGRADTLEEAILMHDGEARRSRDAYAVLDTVPREDLIAFLRSLGGASQYTEGMLAPDDVAPDTGYGAPLPGTDADEFERGRRAFDRDVWMTEGLGPLLNGDSCRACHFQPTIGGAGPVGVDVIRHGRYEGDDFFPPAFGTIAHRHAVESSRPPFMSDANVVETRQTPALFGIGLIDRILESAIVEQQDLTDADGDGVYGRAHFLPDGRLGRFGWKADVPSLAEFTRDALSAELGLTVPARDGLTFGALADRDGTEDPEVGDELLSRIEFFMASLGPPPRARTEVAAEDEGDRLFSELGCDRCHTRELPTRDGLWVPLFSDLLLHEVGPEGVRGVPSGNARGTEMRTPPLWGLATSEPYMHDGRSFTIEEAIASHDGEAASSRERFEDLSAEQRANVLAFLRSL